MNERINNLQREHLFWLGVKERRVVSITGRSNFGLSIGKIEIEQAEKRLQEIERELCDAFFAPEVL